jgi:hypothetical protein
VVTTVTGKMLWFNETKHVGVIETDAGARLSVRGEHFVPGQIPVGRCAGVLVTFDVEGESAFDVSVRPETDVRRARRRRSTLRAQ